MFFSTDHPSDQSDLRYSNKQHDVEVYGEDESEVYHEEDKLAEVTPEEVDAVLQSSSNIDSGKL